MALFAFALSCGGVFADSAAEAPVLRSPGTGPGETVASEDAKIVLSWELPGQKSAATDDADAAGEDGPELFVEEREGPEFELEQARDPDFSGAVTRYRGPDQTSVLTGLAEGEYFFRVRLNPGDGEPGAWSETLAAEVDYFPRWQVFLLVGIGFAVVAATVAAVLHGHFRSPDPTP